MEGLQVEWDPVEPAEQGQSGTLTYRPMPSPDYSHMAFWSISALAILLTLIPKAEDTVGSVLFHLGVVIFMIWWFFQGLSAVLWRERAHRIENFRLLAESKGWMVCPEPDSKRWPALCEKYPQACSPSKPYQVRTQLWGTIGDIDGSTFWFSEAAPMAQGAYSLRVTTKSSNGTYPPEITQREELGVLSICAVPVHLAYDEPVLIEPDLSSVMRGSDVELESNDFNRHFKVKSKAEEAFALLNPAVIQMLMDFRTQFGQSTFLITPDAIIVLMPFLLDGKEVSAELVSDVAESLHELARCMS